MNCANPRIAVGIPIYNDYELMMYALDTIAWYTCRNDFSVFVVDDGSPRRDRVDRARELATAYGATFIEHSCNKGVAASWNTLCKAGIDAGAEYLVLLNSDILVVPRWLDTLVYFFEANKDNTQIGTVYWSPYNLPPHNARQQMAMMRNQLWTTVYTFEPLDTSRAEHGHAPTKWAHCNNALAGVGSLGKTMAPCGCSFALTREIYDQVGAFDETMKSFHEESDYGTRCAAIGKAAFALPYPRPYHGFGQTFLESGHTVSPGLRMNESRKIYRAKHNVPDDIDIHNYFRVVHERYMSQIPETDIKTLVPSATDTVEIQLIDGGRVMLPKLIEITQRV